MTPAVPCPECGAALEIVRQCRMEETYVPKYPDRFAPLPRRTRIVNAGLCPRCEFGIEIREGLARAA